MQILRHANAGNVLPNQRTRYRCRNGKTYVVVGATSCACCMLSIAGLLAFGSEALQIFFPKIQTCETYIAMGDPVASPVLKRFSSVLDWSSIRSDPAGPMNGARRRQESEDSTRYDDLFDLSSNGECPDTMILFGPSAVPQTTLVRCHPDQVAQCQRKLFRTARDAPYSTNHRGLLLPLDRTYLRPHAPPPVLAALSSENGQNQIFDTIRSAVLEQGLAPSRSGDRRETTLSPEAARARLATGQAYILPGVQTLYADLEVSLARALWPLGLNQVALIRAWMLGVAGVEGPAGMGNFFWYSQPEEEVAWLRKQIAERANESDLSIGGGRGR